MTEIIQGTPVWQPNSIVPTNTGCCVFTEPRHWMFLGLSVKGYSGGVNSLNEGGSLQVTLVEDTSPVCEGNLPKLYLDQKLRTEDWTDADPGFLGDSHDIIGRPVVFKYNDFEFAGIISGLTKGTSTSGIEYTVSIDSPYKILHETNVVISDYKGNVSYTPNLINVYGLYEQSGCGTFGDSKNYGYGMPWNLIKNGIAALAGTQTPGGILAPYLQGNRLKLFAGLPYKFGLIPEDDTGYILDLEDVPYAQSYYRIDGTSVGLMEMIDQVMNDANFEYFVELVPCCIDSVVYKLIKIRAIDRAGDVAEGAIDEFLDGYNGGCSYISKILGEELRIEKRNNFVVGPPKAQMFWTEWTQGANGCTSEARCFWDPRVSSLDLGAEAICNSDPMSVLGGVTTTTTTTTTTTSTTPDPANGDTASQPRGGWTSRDICRYDLSADEIAPYWGLDRNGNVIKTFADSWLDGTGRYNSAGYLIAPATIGFNFTMPKSRIMYFYGNTIFLQESTLLLNPPDYLMIGELELVAANQGFDIWESFIAGHNTHSNQLIAQLKVLSTQVKNTGVYNIAHIVNFMNSTYENILKPIHQLNLKKILDADHFSGLIQAEIHSIYSYILNYADKFYGKQYIMSLPYLCVKKDPDTNQVTFNRAISNGGWNEEANVEYGTLIGIDTTSTAMDFFRIDDGRIGPYVRFDYASYLDTDRLTDEEFGYTSFGDGYLWVKCSVKPDFVFGDSTNYTDPYVIVELPAKVPFKKKTHGLNEDGYAVSLYSPAFDDVWTNYRITSKGKAGSLSASKQAPELFCPQPAAITVPLINYDDVYGPWYGVSSITGGSTNFISDTNLTPWNYGSLAEMNSAANDIALFGVSNMYKNESGSITVPDQPKGRLGEEILSFDGTGYVSLDQRYVASRTGTTSGISEFPGVTYIYVQLSVGVASGLLGPIITSMSVSHNQSGMTTSYNFALYNKGYRRFAKSKIDRTSQIGSLKQQLLNRFRRETFGI